MRKLKKSIYIALIFITIEVLGAIEAGYAEDVLRPLMLFNVENNYKSEVEKDEGLLRDIKSCMRDITYFINNTAPKDVSVERWKEINSKIDVFLYMVNEPFLSTSITRQSGLREELDSLHLFIDNFIGIIKQENKEVVRKKLLYIDWQEEMQEKIYSLRQKQKRLEDQPWLVEEDSDGLLNMDLARSQAYLNYTRTELVKDELEKLFAARKGRINSYFVFIRTILSKINIVLDRLQNEPSLLSGLAPLSNI